MSPSRVDHVSQRRPRRYPPGGILGRCVRNSPWEDMYICSTALSNDVAMHTGRLLPATRGKQTPPLAVSRARGFAVGCVRVLVQHSLQAVRTFLGCQPAWIRQPDSHTWQLRQHTHTCAAYTATGNCTSCMPPPTPHPNHSPPCTTGGAAYHAGAGTVAYRRLRVRYQVLPCHRAWCVCTVGIVFLRPGSNTLPV